MTDVNDKTGAGKWTPGPWRVKRWSAYESGVVAPVNGQDSDVCGYALHANAHLIAAAPDLFEALEIALPALAFLQEREGSSLADQLRFAKARAAIAKALGEQL